MTLQEMGKTNQGLLFFSYIESAQIFFKAVLQDQYYIWHQWKLASAKFVLTFRAYAV
jgi:hypothetical protein